MPLLKKTLQNKLKDASRIVIVGIGSELRGDDIVGIAVIRNLSKSRMRSARKIKVDIISGETVPENITGCIRKLKPSHVVLVDCVEMGETPGKIAIVDSRKIGGFSSSTHSLPLSIFLRYLERELGCQTLVIGIQPKNVRFGARVSVSVAKAAKKTTALIREVLY